MIGSILVAITSFANPAMAQYRQMEPQSIGGIPGLSYSVGLPVILAAKVRADKLRTREK